MHRSLSRSSVGVNKNSGCGPSDLGIEPQYYFGSNRNVFGALSIQNCQVLRDCFLKCVHYFYIYVFAILSYVK